MAGTSDQPSRGEREGWRRATTRIGLALLTLIALTLLVTALVGPG